MRSLTRRHFLKSTALTTAAVGLSAKSWSQVAGANSDVRIAVIGFHGRGKEHIHSYMKSKGARITALCDVDSHVLKNGAAEMKKDGLDIETFTDIRKLLESKNVDAISIATPNHWHSLAAIWGIQAGKDVYVEKPVSHNVWEGRQLVRAAEKHKKIVQVGTQSRSSNAIHQAVAYVREGHLGKIILARGLCYKPRASIGKTNGSQPIPTEVDYNLWCGPAPMIPPHRNSAKWGTIHYEWHWFWDYGNGDLGNQGIHQMDIARWFLGEKELSPRVFSVGGRLGYVDDGQTPNTMLVYHDYEKAPLIFEVRGLPEKSGSTKMDQLKGVEIGVIVECENGYAIVTSDYRKAAIYDKDGKKVQDFTGEDNHFGNFVKLLHSRKPQDNRAPILGGHISSALCHTGNISYRVGKNKNPDEIREAIKANKDATKTFDRMAEHLAANGVDLNKDKLTLGQFLKMDPKTETFADNTEANALLKDKYREPFVVPENV